MTSNAPPDPFLVRDDWCSLDGPFDFAPDPRHVGTREGWAGRRSLPGTIRVPYCVEAEASGAAKAAGALDFWYLRRFEVPPRFAGREVWLRIGAADHRCDGFLNGRPLGTHEGGYTPIEWRLDEALRPGENVLVLHVRETRSGRIPRGKQTHLPFAHTIFYRPYSGIWQSVTLEARGATHVARVAGLTAEDGRGFLFRLRLGGPPEGEVELALHAPDGTPDAIVRAPIRGASLDVPVTPRTLARWSPARPSLYDVVVTVRQGGTVVDRVRSYAGLRTIAARDGQVLLDGQPLYQKLVLYQAYYPGGWVTADDATLRRDVETIRAMGFNGLRIHQTIPDPRLLAWCDRLGLLVWEEQPSPFVFSRIDRRAFEQLLRETVDRDLGHPSIVTRVLFNETWGVLDLLWRRETREWIRAMVALCRALDPQALVVDNSGYDHLETDVLDIHHYLADPARVQRLYAALADPAALGHRLWRNLYMLLPNRVAKSPLAPEGRFDGQPIVVSECGGHGFGPYAGGAATLADSLGAVVEALRPHAHIRGFGYTQFCDVAQETNGLVTFAREPKVAPEVVRALLARL